MNKGHYIFLTEACKVQVGELALDQISSADLLLEDYPRMLYFSHGKDNPRFIPDYSRL